VFTCSHKSDAKSCLSSDSDLRFCPYLRALRFIEYLSHYMLPKLRGKSQTTVMISPHFVVTELIHISLSCCIFFESMGGGDPCYVSGKYDVLYHDDNIHMYSSCHNCSSDKVYRARFCTFSMSYIRLRWLPPIIFDPATKLDEGQHGSRPRPRG
jgi:hypothetical protein